MDATYQQLIALAQVIMIDLALAGDNAIVIGLAASRVEPTIRTRVIFWGIVGAVMLRVTFAAVVTQLFAVIGLTLAGGILLLWVCWKMYRELARRRPASPAGAGGPDAVPSPPQMSFANAVTQIVVADLSMSLDNVLAVAGAARNNLVVLIVGLGLSVVLMGFAAHGIATLLSRRPWIAWLGLAIVLYVALDMIWRGVHDVVG